MVKANEPVTVKKHIIMKRKSLFYIFLFLFLIIATGLRSLQINVLNLHIGAELSPLITTLIFILLIKKDSFKLICFNRFDIKTVVIPVLLFLLIIGIDFFIQLQLNLIRHPAIDGSFFTNLAILIIPFTILVGGFEEVAWRGYLISKIIQNRLTWSSLVIITGIMWSIWHLPTHFLKFENHLSIQYPLFILACFEIGIIISYLRIRTNSIIPAIIIHSLIAILYEFFFKPSGNYENYYFLTFPSVALVIMLIPPAFYYYKQGGKLYSEQLGTN